MTERPVFIFHAVPFDFVRDMLHGPVREMFCAAMVPTGDDILVAYHKLCEFKNRIFWLYNTNIGTRTIIPDQSVCKPIYLWNWAIRDYQEDVNRVILLLQHMDCLNDPERAFYRDVMLDLLVTDDEEIMRAIGERVEEVACTCDPIMKQWPDWYLYKKLKEKQNDPA